MKRILLALSLLSGTTLYAQDLVERVPANALAVVSVKGNRLLELLSAQEFNQSFPGKKLLEALSETTPENDYHSIEQLGIRLSGTAWYYYQKTDSIGYHCLLLPLSDAQRFEQFINKDHKSKAVQEGNIHKLVSASDNVIMLWDNQTALLTFGSLQKRYFEDSVVAQRYGIKEVNYSDYYYQDGEEEEATADTTYAAVYDIAVAAVDSAAEAATEEKPEPPMPETVVEEAAPPAEEAVDAPMVVEAAPVAVDPGVVEAPAEYHSRHNSKAYYKAYEEQQQIKKELAQQWIGGYAERQFGSSNIASIHDNAAFQRSQDPEAVATFFLSDFEGLYSGLLPYVTGRYAGNMLSGYKSINARLYMDKESARMVSELEVDETKAASYKKIYGRKVNKKFLKYINGDKMIGFMSYAINTEAYLQEMPELMENVYGRYLGLYHDEIGIGAELFSLLLDEKAVAKVIKGDALFMLTDVGPKQYTYKTYEYDDNYERKEVERTKTETLPDFLLMLSSDDTHLLERVLRYCVHKEYATEQNGIYSLNRKMSKSPFDLHVLIKDGIVFCGTSYRDLQQISNGSYQGSLSAEQKSLITKNNFSLYLNPKNMVGKISEKEFGSSHKLREFNTLMGSTGTLYARSTGVKGNRISGEMVATVPEGKENALKYFFSLVELVHKFD